jgi:hypothetical protein
MHQRALQETWMADTKATADLAFDAFVESYALKYERAADCLSKDRDALLAFYDSRPSIETPADDQSHRKHLRHPAPPAVETMPWKPFGCVPKTLF